MKIILPLLLLVLVLAPGTRAAESRPRPNIVLIVADDMGIGSLLLARASIFLIPQHPTTVGYRVLSGQA